MGRFETYIMPGEAGMSIFNMPEPFVRLEGPTFVPFGRVADVAETVELPPIEVARGVTVIGRLIDASDQPIAHARLFAGPAATIDRSSWRFHDVGRCLRTELTLHVNFTPQDKSSVEAEIVRENPLLLRAPIRAPQKTRDRLQP